jgi:hypothetical protein
MSTDSIGSSGAAPVEEAPQVNTGSGHHSSSEVNGSTKIPTVEALREKAPQVYNQMLVGIGTITCRRMQRSQERVKQIMRKAQAGEA